MTKRLRLALYISITLITAYSLYIIISPIYRESQAIVNLKHRGRFTVSKSSYRFPELFWSHLGDEFKIPHSVIFDGRTNDSQFFELMALFDSVDHIYYEIYNYPDSATSGRYTISNEQIRHLSKHKNLKTLALRGCDITDHGIQQIFAMSQLEGLVISDSNVSTSKLANIYMMNNLKNLCLSYTDIDNESFNHIRMIPNLEGLDIVNTKVTDAAVVYLEKMPKLQRLNIGRTFISREAATILSKERPGLQIYAPINMLWTKKMLLDNIERFPSPPK